MATRTAPTNVPSGVYIIVNGKTRTAIDLLNGSNSSGTAINGWASGYKHIPQSHQEWLIADAGNGQVLIINNQNGLLISAKQGVNAAATGQADAPDQARARWTVEACLDKSDNTVIFRNVQYSNAILDLSGGRAENGTPVLCYPQNSPISDNQTWSLIHV